MTRKFTLLSSKINRIALLVFFLFCSQYFFAQVTITKPNLPIAVCSGYPTLYNALGNIVITEAQNSNFSTGTGVTLVLSAPANFEFQPLMGTVGINSQNLSSASMTVTATTITVTYTCGGTNKIDVITLSGIMVRGINVASTGDITRTGGTGTVNGLVNTTTLTNTLTTTDVAAPTVAVVGANQTLAACATTATLSGNTPVVGTGTWALISGTATITTPSSPTSGVTALGLDSVIQLRWTITNACGTSFDDLYITTATGPGCLSYCIPTSTGNTYPISNVTFAGINNSSSAAVTAGPYYQDFSTTIGTVIPNGTYTFTATDTGLSPNPFGIYVFFDWNNNGNFDDDGGPTTVGTYTTTASGVLSIPISVPGTAIIGSSIRMRVANHFNSVPRSCPQAGSFQDEDYTINVVAGPACAVPTASPGALALTPGGTFINGSFVAASPAPNKYLVVMSTVNTAPTITNGTTYNIGDTFGTYRIIDNDNNLTFVAGSLNTSTTYYFFVYSYNADCTGGPSYKTTAPSTGNATTTATAPTYCSATTTSTPINRLYVSKVSFVGTLQDTSNTSTNGVAGYQDFTTLPTLSIQAQGGPVNLEVTSTPRGFWKVWVDWNKNGLFTDAGEEVYNPSGYLFTATSFGFIVPPTAVPGNYRMRVRVQNTYQSNNPGAGTERLLYFDSCNTFTGPYTISGDSYDTYGEAEDYLFTVIAKCDNKITSISNPAICGNGAATLSAIGTGTDIKWYAALTGGAALATTANGAAYSPVIAATTTYYITSWSATCETLTRIPVTVIVKPVPALIIANPTPTICGENAIIQLDATGNNEIAYLVDEDFELGTLGAFTSINSDVTTAAQKAKTAWKTKTSIFVVDGNRWWPAISSGFGPNKFALTSMDDFKTVALPTTPMQNSLTLATGVNPAATGFTTLTLDLKMYYSRYYADGASPTLENCKVEVQSNGGAWTTLSTITADQGYGSNFISLTYNLNTYITSTNLKIRIKALGDGTASGTAGDGVAVDDIKLYGSRPLIPYFALGGGVNAFTNAGATIPYTGDQRNTIWIKPTLTQLESASFVINVNANLNNGCTTSGTINVTNQTKIWKGTTDNDWNKTSNWLPAVIPDATTCVIIPTGSSSQIMNAPNALAKNLTIKAPTGNLELQAAQNLTITDWINVENGATFNVRNSANLVQVTAAPVPANSGSINMQRNANVRLQDYVYYASPVASFASSTISPTTTYIYKWTPTIGANTNGWGNWTGGSETMTAGKGYIVRGPSAYSNAVASIYTATFAGVPNNGTITTPVLRGTYNGADYSTGVSTTLATKDDDNWNLLGNPYPSAINPTQFLAANTNLAGFVKIWTHGTLPVSLIDPFYQNFAYNYTSGDYVTYNGSGSTAGPGVSQISAGQGFFTLMNHTSAAASENVTFTNAMRRDGSGNPYNNSQFFKGENVAPVENHRIWLDLVTATNKNVRTLVGYIDGATNGSDRLYDAFTDEKLSLNLYSLIGTEKFNIQGKQLPFENTDFVPMGFKTNESGTHNIAIATVDGLFSDVSQNIIIEDKLLNKTHNLKESPYAFTTAAGIYNDRFVLRYSKTTLSTHDFDANAVKVFANNNVINITSKNQVIKDVIVYDVLGKIVTSKTNINKEEISLNELKQTSTMLIVKVILGNNEEVITKVIF